MRLVDKLMENVREWVSGGVTVDVGDTETDTLALAVGEGVGGGVTVADVDTDAELL